MKRFTTRTLGAVIAYAVVVVTAPAAMAQSAGDGSVKAGDAQGQDSDDIVVTARKIAENVQSVPLSLTAISDDQLTEQSVRTVNDLQTTLPNVFLQQHPSEPQSLSLAIRGQKQNDIPLTLDPSVGVYVDGLYYPRTIGLRGNLIDVTRVEVLRGPQGTLYGRNTTGGALSIYTNDPVLGRVEGSAEASYGNYDAVNLVGVLNVPLGDTVAIRVAGQWGQHGGYGTDGLGRELANEDGYYLRGKLLFEPFDGFRAVLFGNYQSNKSGGAINRLAGLSSATLPGGPTTLEAIAELYGPAALAAGNPNIAAQTAAALATLHSYQQGNGDFYHTFGTYPNYSNFDGYTIGLDLSFDLTSSLKFRSITGYEKLNRVNNGDYDGTPFTIVHALRTTNTEYYSQELQLLGSGKNLNWVLGFYGGDEKGTDTTFATSLLFLNPLNPNQFDASAHNTNWAAFAQANWEFVPNWRLTLGARYSEDYRDLTVRNRNASGCTVPAPGVSRTPPGASQCPRSFKDNFSDPSWLASVDYQATPDMLFYAKIAHGYRTGGRNQRGANAIESFDAFQPETVTEYEAGAKLDLFDRIVRFNLAVYYDDYKNIQRSVGVPTVTGVPTTIVTNAASGRVKGFEAELRVRPTIGLTLNGTLGLTDARYDRFVDLTGDRSHETFGVPKWTASAGARYAVRTGMGEASIQADYRWQSEVVLVPDAPTPSQVTQGAYGLLNGRIALKIESLGAEVAVYGRNLLGKEYFAAGASSERSVGYNYLVVGEPRTYGLQVIKRF